MYQNSIYSKIKSLKWNLRGILRPKLLLVFRLLKVHKWCFHCFHFMHVFQSYRNYIKVKPTQIHNRKLHKFPFFSFIKNKTNSGSCLNKKHASQALCILQYIFKVGTIWWILYMYSWVNILLEEAALSRKKSKKNYLKK